MTIFGKTFFENTENRPEITFPESNKKRFGMVNGRFQPFHMGHVAIINEILLDGLIPIIVLGSSNHNRDITKNPLSYAQRKELIRLIYPNVPIVFVRGIDRNDWDEWYRELTTEIEEVLYKEFDILVKLQEDIIVFHNNKEVDKTSFEFKDKAYHNTWYTDIFDDEGFETQEVKFVKRDDIKIDSNARDIRENLEGMKHLLDARVYFKLKEWGW